jgi:hypothetical protein
MRGYVSTGCGLRYECRGDANACAQRDRWERRRRWAGKAPTRPQYRGWGWRRR